MRTADRILLTGRGWEKLQGELLSLRKQRASAPRACVEIAEAAEPGEGGLGYVQSDLASLDRRISQLEQILSRAVPVGPDHREPGVAGVGSRVAVCWEDGEREDYVLVGPPEVDLQAGYISYESPVGGALLGRREGDWVEVAAPQGPCRLQVVMVE